MSILNLIALFYAYFSLFSHENVEVKKSVEFQKIVISTEFVSEGVCVGDINKDGNKDIIAGAFWYEAPTWVKHQFSAEGAAEAAKLYQDAIGWVERIVSEDRFRAEGIYGFFPANAVGDDIIVWTDESRTTERTRFHSLRQQIRKDSGKPNVALADWVAPVDQADYIGGFVVGIHGADEFAAELDAQIDPYGSIMVKAIADRFAEAFAEYLHHQARIQWGYETEDELTHDQLIHENYRGIRPAPGYPAQPDHTEKPLLFELLDAAAATGVTLTESCAMHPGAAVCGLYFSHPDSHYFALSELQKDQIEDYAMRKGIGLAEAEKWLGPWLGYA